MKNALNKVTGIKTRFFAFWLTGILLVIIHGFVSAQTTLYSENFGTTTAWPTGWSTSGTYPWQGSTNGGTGYPGASGSGSVIHTTAQSASGTLTYSNNLSTVGYTNITVLWGAMRVGQNNAIFQYSTNGTTWNTVSFTDDPNDGTVWSLVNGGVRIILPEDAKNVSNLRFRWTHTSNTNPQYYYRIDDFSVQGTPSCPTITASVTGQTNVSCNAGTDGTITASASGGTAPYTFSSDNGTSYVPCNNTPAAGQHTFNGLSANVVYRIRVKDANGCESAEIQ